MIEAAHIDKASHDNNYNLMKEVLVDFDKSISLIYDFVKERKNIHLFIITDFFIFYKRLIPQKLHSF
jgi:alkaline phosphatase